MKKILLGLCILQTLSLESAQRFTHYSTLLKSGIAAVRTLTQPTYKAPVRQLTDLAALKGCDALGVYSPTIGALAVTPFPELNRPQPLIAKWYTEEHSPLKDLARLFFYQNPVDLKVELTQYDKGIVQAFPPALVADLLKASEQKTALSAQQKDVHITDWYKRYTQTATTINEPYSEKSFRKKALQFLKTFETVTEKTSHNQTSFLLLAVLFKAAQNRSDLQTFARSHDAALNADCYTQDDFEKLDPCFNNWENHYDLKNKTHHGSYLEKLLYWKVTSHAKAINSKNDVPTYPPALLQPPSISLSYKGSRHTALCMEEALRTFINCLLYNPSTGAFDFSLLPNDIQEQCQKNNPAFYAFVQRYNNPCAPDYYKKSAQEWLALVAELPGIEYHSKNFELYGGCHQILKVICHLFGISPVQSYKKLATLLSTGDRTIQLDQNGDSIELSFSKQDSPIKIGTAHFNRTHGYFSFFTSSISSTTRTILEETYNTHIANDETQYRTLYCGDVKTMTLDAFKQGIDELSKAELELFMIRNTPALEHLAEHNKNDHLFYLLAKPELENSNFNFNILLLNMLTTGNEPVAQLIFTTKKINPSYIQGGSNMTFLNQICLSYKQYSTDFIQSLINAYPEALDLHDCIGRTPLFNAAASQNVTLVDFLLTQGANPNIKDTNGDTALHYLSQFVGIHSKEILLLIKSGKCDLSLRNNKGKTALEIMRNETSRYNTAKLREIEVCIALLPPKELSSMPIIPTPTPVQPAPTAAQETILEQPASSLFTRTLAWLRSQNNQ